MLIKIGISCLLAIAASTAQASPGLGNITNDTLDILDMDSISAVVSDPKSTFRDLFTVEESGGIDITRLNPLAVGFVEDYIDSHGKMLEDLKDRARPYFDKMDAVLTKHGLPKELKYLAVIESQLKTHARSWAGAVGPWQLMPATARNLGLRVNRSVDERKDFIKSTHAASKYLNSLYKMYGNWLLVIAAYNGGPGKVNAAIKKSGSRDFWKLQKYLPAESRKHVKKFIATHYIMEGSGGITTLTQKEAEQYLAETDVPVSTGITGDLEVTTISGRYLASIISKHLEMDKESFMSINPDFDTKVAKAGKYDLRLPSEKMVLFREKKAEILKETIDHLLNPNAPVARSL